MISKNKLRIRRFLYNQKPSFLPISDKGIMLDNFIDLSLCPWRDSNEASYLWRKPRLLGPFMIYNIDGPEGVDYQLLYIFYIQNLKFSLKKTSFWGTPLQPLFEKICSKHFDFLSVHYLYFRDLWLRPTSILEVWTAEEDLTYRHINYYQTHIYGWSHPKNFVNLIFPLIGNFKYFFDFSKGPDLAFCGYNQHEYVKYAYTLRERQRYYKYYNIPLSVKEKEFLNELLPFEVQENYRSSDWPLSPYSLLYEQSLLDKKFDFLSFYVLSFYHLRQSFFLQTLFLDGSIKKLFQYGLLGYFFFGSTSHFLEDSLERKTVLLFDHIINESPVEMAEDEIIEEDDFGYDVHTDADLFFDSEDTEEDFDIEGEPIEDEEDLDPLEDIGFLDFEVEEDANDEMEFNEDRFAL